MLTLYYAPNTCSLATHITLRDAGAEFQLQRIDFVKKQQVSPEFLSINTKARVPALMTENGVLTETPAMLVYIAQTFPEKCLASVDDPFSFAQLQAFNSYLCSTVHVAHAHGKRGYRWADETSSFDDMKRKLPYSVRDAFKLIETDFLKGPWVMGESYSIADAYLFTLAQWIEVDGVDPHGLPRIIEHRARMRERESVKQALHAETH